MRYSVPQDTYYVKFLCGQRLWYSVSSLTYNTVLPHHSLERQFPVQSLIQYQPECRRWWTKREVH